jgi:hypothetical protein
MAGLLATLPRNQKISTSDLILPISPLTNSYTLTLALATLFTHATLALTSVAGPAVDISLTASTISPTIIIASSQSTLQYHCHLLKGHQTPLLSKLSRYWQNKSLQKGIMPQTPSFAAPTDPNNHFLSKLRLLLIHHPAEDTAAARLSTANLADLKILLGARTCLALTASGVAGAIAQTNMFDYRRSTAGGDAHFGPPLSCVEVLLVGENDVMLGGEEPQGQVRQNALPPSPPLTPFPFILLSY